MLFAYYSLSVFWGCVRMYESYGICWDLSGEKAPRCQVFCLLMLFTHYFQGKEFRLGLYDGSWYSEEAGQFSAGTVHLLTLCLCV